MFLADGKPLGRCFAFFMYWPICSLVAPWLGVQLRPIVSSRGAISYETTKELARVLKPQVGKSAYSVQNTRNFVEQLKNIKLQPNESIISYVVKALFIAVPTKPAIDIIRKHPEDDKDLQQRTSMAVNHIICLLTFCLKNTYFIFQGSYYKQVERAPMGSPISPIVANLYMEAFEVKALNTAHHPPNLWRRFVDATFVVQAAHKDRFTEHINSIDDRIQFTMEESRSDGSMPSLDTLVIP